MVQDYTIDLLRMALKTLEDFASRYLPHSDSAVVAAANKSVTVSSNRADGVMVTCESTDEVRVVVVVGRCAGLHDAAVSRLGQLPYTKGRVS
jgi:hypothetical protein